MQSKIVETVRITILIICLLGIGHEIYVIFSYSAENLHKSSITICLYFFIILNGIVYDRTNFFRGVLVKVSKVIFISVIAAFIFILLLMYAFLFGEYSADSRIHRFAPFNFALMLFLFLIALISVFGEHHLGFINRIKSIRR